LNMSWLDGSHKQQFASRKNKGRRFHVSLSVFKAL